MKSLTSGTGVTTLANGGAPARMISATLRRGACALVLVLAASAAPAQPYARRPLRLVVPFAAGGAVDVLARLLGNKLADQIGQPVIVENRPGAGGQPAAHRVAHAPPH